MNLHGLLVCVLAASAVFSMENSERQREEAAESMHKINSLALLIFVWLMVIVVLTIWQFKVRRFRILHETGLSLIYGIILGLLIRWLSGKTKQPELCGCQLDEFLLNLCEPTNVSNMSTPTTMAPTGGNMNSWVPTVSVHKKLSTTKSSEESCPIPDTCIYASDIPDTVTVRFGQSKYLFKYKEKVYSSTSGSENDDQAVFDPELFFYVLLPPIIFFAGYDLKKRYFFRNIGAIMLYAFLGTSVSCFIIGAIMYGYRQLGLETLPEDLNFVECLMFGALISATDPVTVLAIFHDMHVDVDLFAFVFGESVMNDAVAIVLYTSIKAYSPTIGSGTTFQALAFFKSVGKFVGIFVGSFAIGLALALITALMTKFLKLREYPLFETSLLFLMSYSAFLLAEFVGFTGIVAVLFCGVAQAHYSYFNLSQDAKLRSKQVFEMLNFLAENFIFVYMGVTLFTFQHHEWHWGFICFSFVAILAGRICNIYPLSFLVNLLRKGTNKIPWSFQHMLVFAGLRGAIAFSLAIRNTDSAARQLILDATLIIVFVTVFVNGGLTTIMLQFFKIKVGVEEDEEEPKFQSIKMGNDVDGSENPRSFSHVPASWYERSFIARNWRNFDSRFIRPIVTDIGSVPASCPSWMRRIAGGGRTKGDILGTEMSDEEEEDEIQLARASLSFRNDNYMNVEDNDDIGAGDLGLGDVEMSEIDSKR